MNEVSWCTQLQGQFCEHCSDGYTRDPPNGGPLATCKRCFCYNHDSADCDRETGYCTCTDNTTGPQCQLCLPGFYGNAMIGRPSTSNDTFLDCTIHVHCVPKNVHLFIFQIGLNKKVDVLGTQCSYCCASVCAWWLSLSISNTSVVRVTYLFTYFHAACQV